MAVRSEKDFCSFKVRLDCCQKIEPDTQWSPREAERKFETSEKVLKKL
jgi:hypothetical protein